MDQSLACQARAYSIVSSPRRHGRKVHLCILIDEWTIRDEEEHRCGLCTGYLRREVAPVERTAGASDTSWRPQERLWVAVSQRPAH
eukprot:4977548-Pyramimonas_sp.AAC.1